MFACSGTTGGVSLRLELSGGTPGKQRERLIDGKQRGGGDVLAWPGITQFGALGLSGDVLRGAVIRGG